MASVEVRVHRGADLKFQSNPTFPKYSKTPTSANGDNENTAGLGL